jgi:hypothetical protein
MMAPTLRFILSLLALQSSFTFAVPQHGEIRSLPESANAPALAQKLQAPAGCKKLPKDVDWPAPDVVNKELPGWEAPMPDGDKKHPDYIYEVKTVASTQRAVKFAAKHNVRLSIINSGHDFLGR